MNTDTDRYAKSAAPQPQVVPGFNHVAAKKLKELQARGYTVAGYSIEKTSESGVVERGFITSGGFVGWWQGQHTNQQPLADALDADFEAVRKKLCKLQRYSFLLDEHGGVRRVDDRCGNWIEFDAAHELFDPIAIDAAIAAAKENK